MSDYTEDDLEFIMPPDRLVAENNELRAEIERLRHAEYHHKLAIDRCKELEAEVERLRAALKEILDMWQRGHTVRIGEVARAALEEKA